MRIIKTKNIRIEIPDKSKCEWCKKEVDMNSAFCSRRCRDKFDYSKNPKKYKEWARNWELKNPEKRKKINKRSMTKFRKEKLERFNELMRQSYIRNKGKWQSREKTRRIVKRKYIKIIKKVEMGEECKECGSKKDLQIHHEIYPKTDKGIVKAIEEGKIYRLCRKHHNLTTKK